MTLVFNNRALLPLAVLIAVPLLLHLFARSRPPRFLFSSTELLQRAVRATMRVRRPKDWLLLLLRTLLALALVGLFLRPVLFSGRQAPAPGAGRQVVVVVDATASMGCTEGGQTRFGAACAEAIELLRGLGARDQANVVWLKAQPESVFPEMATNAEHLREALRRGQVRPEAGSPAAAVALAVELLKDQSGRREICVISDFQRTTWRQAPPAAPREIQLSYIRVGSGVAPNGAIGALAVRPEVPLSGEPLTVVVEVRNFDALPANRTVFLAADGSRQSREVVVPGWGSANASFALPPAQDWLALEATLDEDAFPADDRRWLAVAIEPHLRIGVLGADPATAPAWTRACRSFEWARVESVAPDELNPETGIRALLLAGWDGSHAEALASLAANGRTLICAPAAGVLPTALADLLGASAPPTDARPLARELHDEPLALTCPRPDDAVLRIFENGARGNPARLKLRARLRLPADLLAGGEVVLAYADGIPALVRFAPAVGGARWLWNLPLDAASGGYGASPEFVCLLGEILLASRSGLGAAAAETPSGLAITRDQPVGASAPELLDEAGRVVTVRAESGRLTCVVPPPPGLYRWTRAGQTEACAVVNFPADESDLRTAPPDQTAGAAATAMASGRQVRRLRDGLPLWPVLLGAASGLTLLELLAARWADAARRSAT